MIETVFIRQHDQILPERCDQAHVPITRDAQTYYVGMVSGKKIYRLMWLSTRISSPTR